MKAFLKTLLLSTALVGAVTAAASAKVETYYRSGLWEAYAGTDETNAPVCGISVSNTDKSLTVKVWPNTESITVLMVKSSWRIPDGTAVQVELGFDKNAWGSTSTAYGGTRDDAPGGKLGFVEVSIAMSAAADFFENFTNANTMWLRFPGGNETPWFADMRGSRNVTKALLRCAKAMKGSTTQPFGKAPATQPFGQQPAAEKPKQLEGAI